MNPGTEIDGANGDRLPGMQSPVVERGLMVAHREDRGKVGKPNSGRWTCISFWNANTPQGSTKQQN